MSEDDYDIAYNIALLGMSGCGKSSIMRRFVESEFIPHENTTIGIDFSLKTFAVDCVSKDHIPGENKSKLKIKLRIWDTAGQERFRSLIQTYYRNAHGIILVFDLTNVESFKDLNYWFSELNSKGRSDVPLILVGNKTDMISPDFSTSCVTDDDIQKFLDDRDVRKMMYIKSSAKTGDMINDIFQSLAIKMVEQFGTEAGRTESRLKKTALGTSVSLPVSLDANSSYVRPWIKGSFIAGYCCNQ